MKQQTSPKMAGMADQARLDDTVRLIFHSIRMCPGKPEPTTLIFMCTPRPHQMGEVT